MIDRRPRDTTRRFVTAVAVIAMACAPAAVGPPAASLAPLPPLPRSSIAAVLGHRSELHLTEDQVKRLQDLDDDLDANQSAVRAQLALGPPDGGEIPEPEPPKKTDDDQMGGAGGMGAMGGMGGAMGGMGGAPSHKGSGDPSPPKPPGPTQAQKRADLLRRIDDNDTNAYLQAEDVLTEEQKPLARRVASKYRADLYDRREQTKK